MGDGQLLGELAKIVSAQWVSDQRHQQGKQRRLRQLNGGLGAVLKADNDVALDQGEPLAQAKLAARLLFSGLVRSRRLLAAAVGDVLLLILGCKVSLAPGFGAVGIGDGVHAGEEHLRIQLGTLHGRRAGGADGGRVEELD